ncbi:crotonase/enoyl-CoA hydratase family protein [Paraliomyxa miuraensis]|uniref:crotonase/enoyl-CoA hydratase family protein n=1 Tax=Paraliomyxa miuraensis TaxID=376150 RepID=UPI0022558D66|nr:crotonase/enoyl-CoA hydratase family protein [Paraliomyxa miuraensis]MCX4245467.1 crotonase/enoyl-CoA hydratase family protein [Paraliomyxa miuraensis]
MTDFARYERDETVATITMDDGKANALGPDMIAAVNAGLDRAEEDQVRAVVLAGRPGRFCAGFDLRVLTSGRAAAEPLVRAGAGLFMRIYGFAVPVIAACTGHALAGGALLLLVSDARVGALGEFKVGLNEVAIGIPLPELVRRLAEDRLDVRHRVEATLLAKVYEPAGALGAGYLDEVVPPAELLARAHERARELARLPVHAFSTSKKNVRGASIAHIESALEDDLTRILLAGRT